MQRIFKDDRTIKYVSDVRDIQKYLPQDEMLLSVKMLENDSRKMLYEKSGWYHIEKCSKVKGIYNGNICPVCESGEMVDMGGCQTCNSCGSQLKCGL